MVSQRSRCSQTLSWMMLVKTKHLFGGNINSVNTYSRGTSLSNYYAKSQTCTIELTLKGAKVETLEQSVDILYPHHVHTSSEQLSSDGVRYASINLPIKYIQVESNCGLSIQPSLFCTAIDCMQNNLSMLDSSLETSTPHDITNYCI